MAAPRARPGRPAGSDGEQTRRRIMLAAMGHVAEHGYSRATLKEIAAEAGLTTATIYHYFPTKLELVATTFTELVAPVLPQLTAATANAETLPETMTVLLDYAIEPVRELPHLTAFHAAVGAERTREPVLGKLFDDTLESMRTLVENLVDAAKQHGSLRDDVDHRAVVDMLFALLRGLIELSASVPADRHRAALLCTEAMIRGELFAPREGTPGT